MKFEDFLLLGAVAVIAYFIFGQPAPSPTTGQTRDRVSQHNAAWWTAAGIPGIYAGMLMSDAQPILNANAGKITAYMLLEQGGQSIPLPQ